jgi:SLT domain-containing protein
MNAMARSGNMSGIRSMMGYADGGIAGFFNNVAGNISSFVSNPLGGFMDLIKKPVDAMLAGIGGGNWGKMFAALPEKLVNTLMGHANPPSAPVSGGTGTFVAGGGAGGAQRWAGTVLQALNMVHQPAFLLPSVLRRMNQESGGNPNAINNWDSNAAMGDPSRGLMQTIGSTFAAYAMPGHNTNIYDPLSNILASMRYALSRYGSLANAYDRAGGYAMGGVVPARLYDQGGYLPTGTTLVQNNTGQPERVLAPGQTGMEGQTMVLEIPELGGRLKAYVTAVVNDHNAAVTRSLRNSAGIPKGGF